MSNLFDRDKLDVKPLAERISKLEIDRDAVDYDEYPVELSTQAEEDIDRAATEIRNARKRNASVMLAFGAHSIKNGLAPVLIRLMKDGWITHFATNGAGIIHDWEFAYQGKTGENVQKYTCQGQFGIWQETGAYLNLAIAVGALNGLGYGQSVGEMMHYQGIELPTREELIADIERGTLPTATPSDLDLAGAAADLLQTMVHYKLKPGFIAIDHPWRQYSLACQAAVLNVPFTCHPMMGHDIIYTHPYNQCSSIGRAAQRDFLSYAHSVTNLEGGVYLSVGSAIMSPMIFEKSLSMARNVARQQEKTINNFAIHVVDLAKSSWDWKSEGEPPMDNPAYYLRFCKTFSRMGGEMTYCSADNRSWLVALLKKLS